MSDLKRGLAGCGRREFMGALEAAGALRERASMRLAQAWRGVYRGGARSFGEITPLGRDLSCALDAGTSLGRASVKRRRESRDGSRKWLLEMEDGALVETVYIPGVGSRQEGRGALCLSSQVGCALGCRFCLTGRQGLARNLTSREIVMQALVVWDELGEWEKKREDRSIATAVFMGMGEPLHNLDAVSGALEVLCDGDGMGLSRRKVTVSTVGVAPKMGRLARECGTLLAVSLHAPRDDLRNELAPLNRKHGLGELMEACREYASLTKGRRITFEYVMLDGVNDTDADARDTARLLRGIPAKVNLIPFNPWPGAVYRSSTPGRISSFAGILRKAGYAAPVRRPRGRDVMAACGQLSSATRRAPAATRLKREVLWRRLREATGG